MFPRSGPNRGCAGQDTGGRCREIVDDAEAKLVNAGWSCISGQNTGDVPLESATPRPRPPARFACASRTPVPARPRWLRSLPGILPPLDFPEALETTQVHSVAGTLAPNAGLLHERSFRAPPNKVFDAALIGDGTRILRPGEVSLAHKGELFLDELSEFPRKVRELPGQPLEDRAATLARSRLTLTLPARFILVAAMNTCPCRHQLTQPYYRRDG